MGLSRAMGSSGPREGGGVEMGPTSTSIIKSNLRTERNLLHKTINRAGHAPIRHQAKMLRMTNEAQHDNAVDIQGTRVGPIRVSRKRTSG